MSMIGLGSALGELFENGAGPSHDQLDQAFRRTGLVAGDPAPGGQTSSGAPLGKTKRVRAVFVYASDHAQQAGLELAQQIVALCRADGLFDQDDPSFATTDKVRRLRSAFDGLGYVLEADGAVRVKVVDNLQGTELTDALRAYVDRINRNPDDTALQVGTGKDLDEAVARHVLEQHLGSYPTRGQGSNFPFTLSQAFSLIGWSVPPAPTAVPDPRQGVEQALFQLATAVNRLRNEVGTGHGRPSASSATRPLSPSEARLVARATALVAGALLDSL